MLESLGYHVELGPEVETEWYNFEALNLTEGHPARENWDSFFFTRRSSCCARTRRRCRSARCSGIKEPPDLHHHPGRVLPPRRPRGDHASVLQPGRGARDRRGPHRRRPEGHAALHDPVALRRERKVRVRPTTSPSPSRASSSTVVRHLRRRGLPELRARGLARGRRLRDGPPAGPAQRRHRPERYWNGYAWGFGIERMAMLKHDVRRHPRSSTRTDLRFLEQF